MPIVSCPSATVAGQVPETVATLVLSEPPPAPSRVTVVLVVLLPASRSPERTVTSYVPLGTSRTNVHAVASTKSRSAGSSAPRSREIGVTPSAGTMPNPVAAL
jgi:hypothetical protein